MEEIAEIAVRQENPVNGNANQFSHISGWFRTKSPIPLTGTFVLLIFYTLYFASPVLIPIALAFLLSVLLSPFVDQLERRRVPRVAGAAIVIIIVFGAISAGLISVASPAQEWISRLPENFKKIEQKLRSIKKPLQDFQKATQEIENAADISDRPHRTKVEIQKPGIIEDIFSGTQRAFATIGVTLILTISLLASGGRLLRKIVSIFSTPEHRDHATAIVRSIRHDLSYYLAGITMINIGLGVSVGLLAYILGVANALLWGSVAGVLSFAPYIGSLANMIILTLVGLVQFDTIAAALALPLMFLALSAFVQSVVVPYVLGRRLLLNPIAIFLAILIWGWMWGVPGALLAVPLLVSFKIICERLHFLRHVAELLAP